jgi:hypothetical protein
MVCLGWVIGLMDPIGLIAKDVLCCSFTIHYSKFTIQAQRQVHDSPLGDHFLVFGVWCSGGSSFMVAPDGKEEGKLGDGLYGIGADDFTFAGIAAQNAVSACDRAAGDRRARRMAVSRLVKRQRLAVSGLVGDLNDLWPDGHITRHLRYARGGSRGTGEVGGITWLPEDR